MSTNNGGIQHLICDISSLAHDVSSLLCGGGGNGGTQSHTSFSLPPTFQPIGGNSGGTQPICQVITNDVKHIVCDIVGLIPSGCGGGYGGS